MAKHLQRTPGLTIRTRHGSRRPSRSRTRAWRILPARALEARLVAAVSTGATVLAKIPLTLPAILLAAILNSRIARGRNNEKSKNQNPESKLEH